MQPKYTRGKPVDKERLAQYIEAAKGPGRTMKQFAEECEVNPSTLSRIANKKLVGGSSEALMQAIFEHADPNSGLTLDALMDANGMMPVGSNRFMHLGEFRFQVQAVTEVIMGEMMRRVKATGYLPRQLRLSKSIGYRMDVVCESEEFGGNGMWAMDVLPVPYVPHDANPNVAEDSAVMRRIKMMNNRRFFDRLARYAAISYFHPEEVPQRFSFIILDKNFYEDIIEEYGEQEFQGDVSLIHIDLNSLKVLDEFVFLRRDGKKMEKFFTVPANNGKLDDVEGLIDIDDIHLGGSL